MFIRKDKGVIAYITALKAYRLFLTYVTYNGGINYLRILESLRSKYITKLVTLRTPKSTTVVVKVDLR